MSTVGYGCSVSMPNLTDFDKDYLTMMIQILISVIIFTFCQAQLTSLLENMAEEHSSETVQTMMKESLEIYYLRHNEIE